MPTAPTVGEIFPNYPAICSYLGEPVKTGQAKTDQLKHWSEHFRWEKQGHKFIIKEVIKPLSPRKKKYHTETKWYPNISRLFLHYTAAAANGYGVNDASFHHRELMVTSREIYYLVGLCNPMFSRLKHGIELDNIDTKAQKNYHRKIGKEFYQIASRILVSLQKQKIIKYKRPYFVCPLEGGSQLATPEESISIIKIRDHLLKEFGMKSEAEILGTMFELLFYQLLNKELQIAYPELKSCYKVHHINFPITTQEIVRQNLLRRTDRDQLKKNINEKAVEKCSTGESCFPEELIDAVIRITWDEDTSEVPVFVEN